MKKISTYHTAYKTPQSAKPLPTTSNTVDGYIREV